MGHDEKCVDLSLLNKAASLLEAAMPTEPVQWESLSVEGLTFTSTGDYASVEIAGVDSEIDAEGELLHDCTARAQAAFEVVVHVLEGRWGRPEVRAKEVLPTLKVNWDRPARSLEEFLWRECFIDFVIWKPRTGRALAIGLHHADGQAPYAVLGMIVQDRWEKRCP